MTRWDEIDEARRLKHLPIAGLLRNPDKAQDVVRLARVQISLWKENNLCSKDFIDMWDELLDTPIRAAELLESKSRLAAMLRQNSPFVSTIRKLKEN